MAQASRSPTPSRCRKRPSGCLLPGFRKRGFVPKVLYPEISQTRPAPKQQEMPEIKTSELELKEKSIWKEERIPLWDFYAK